MGLVAIIVIIGSLGIFVLSILGIVRLMGYLPTIKKRDKEEDRQADTIGHF